MTDGCLIKTSTVLVHSFAKLYLPSFLDLGSMTVFVGFPDLD